jgi:non-heme Fe2+,alpha-ketoglutarate-dependent halogenase
MGKILSAAEIDAYNERGYHFPLRVMSPGEAAGLRTRLEEFEAERRKRMQDPGMQKLYLLQTWVADLVRNPVLLDAVEDILGPDLLCWQSSFFIKEPASKGFVSWHQDATYWGLSSPDVCTAWFAFSPATLESGAMKVSSGSHLLPQLPHNDTFNPDNLLTRGQEIETEVDPDTVVDMVLEPGEVSLHHIKLAHASAPNRSNDRRIGLAIRYIGAHVNQTSGVPDSAMLVRGEDKFGHFEAETPPVSDMHPDAVALHKRITETRQKFIYAGTDKGAHRKRPEAR